MKGGISMQRTSTNRRPRQVNSIPAGRLNIREVQPDEWDRALLAEAERENDGSTISLERLAEEMSGRFSL